MSKTIQEFRSLSEEVLQRKFKPVYLLQGEETYFTDALSDLFLEHLLPESERSFNQFVFYGKDVSASDVVAACKRFPMMSDRLAVVVKEGQDMKNAELLIPYLNNPLNSTVLIVVYRGKKIPGNTNLFKSFKSFSVFNSDRLYDNEAQQWIRQHCKEKGFTIEDPAAQMIFEYLGNDLHKISNALSQVMLHTDANKQIGTSLIQDHVGIDRHYNLFELQKAIGLKQKVKVMEISVQMGKNIKDNPLVMLTGSLYSYFSKLIQIKLLTPAQKSEIPKIVGTPSPYILKEYEQAVSKYTLQELEQAFSILREFDQKAKGIGVTGSDDAGLMKEMTLRLISEVQN